jgi:membrane fusion protein, multidrug efflux system
MRFFTSLFFALLFILLTLSACGTQSKPALDKSVDARNSTALPIRVSVVGPGTVVETLGVQGRFEVWQRIILSAKVSGIMEEVPVLQNQEVKKGDLIFRLQAPIADIEASLRAQSKLTRARRDLDRRLQLREIAPETISVADLDTARDLVTDSEIEVSLYQRREESRTVVAPFSGVLLMPPTTSPTNTQPVISGQQISEGFQVAELLDLSRFRLTLDLPETNLRRLAIGQNIEITAIADGVVAMGKINSLPEAIDALKGSGRVLVDIVDPPKSWRPGGFATAKLVLEETQAPMVIARDAVLYRENRPYAWIAEEHEGLLVVRRAWVDLGPGDARSLSIIKGISAGERVVIEGMSGLSDGIPVVMRENTTASSGNTDEAK